MLSLLFVFTNDWWFISFSFNCCQEVSLFFTLSSVSLVELFCSPCTNPSFKIKSNCKEDFLQPKSMQDGAATISWLVNRNKLANRFDNWLIVTFQARVSNICSMQLGKWKDLQLFSLMIIYTNLWGLGLLVGQKKPFEDVTVALLFNILLIKGPKKLPNPNLSNALGWLVDVSVFDEFQNPIQSNSKKDIWPY